MVSARRRVTSACVFAPGYARVTILLAVFTKPPPAYVISRLTFSVLLLVLPLLSPLLALDLGNILSSLLTSEISLPSSYASSP